LQARQQSRHGRVLQAARLRELGGDLGRARLPALPEHAHQRDLQLAQAHVLRLPHARLTYTRSTTVVVKRRGACNPPEVMPAGAASADTRPKRGTNGLTKPERAALIRAPQRPPVASARP